MIELWQAVSSLTTTLKSQCGKRALGRESRPFRREFRFSIVMPDETWTSWSMRVAESLRSASSITHRAIGITKC